MTQKKKKNQLNQIGVQHEVQVIQRKVIYLLTQQMGHRKTGKTVMGYNYIPT